MNSINWTQTRSDEWTGIGEIHTALIVEQDGIFAATLFVEIPATRWEPADQREIDEQVFLSLANAKRWVEAKESVQIAYEILNDIQIDETDLAYERATVTPV